MTLPFYQTASTSFALFFIMGTMAFNILYKLYLSKKSYTKWPKLISFLLIISSSILYFINTISEPVFLLNIFKNQHLFFLNTIMLIFLLISILFYSRILDGILNDNVAISNQKVIDNDVENSIDSKEQNKNLWQTDESPMKMVNKKKEKEISFEFNEDDQLEGYDRLNDDDMKNLNSKYEESEKSNEEKRLKEREINKLTEKTAFCIVCGKATSRKDEYCEGCKLELKEEDKVIQELQDYINELHKKQQEEKTNFD